MSIISNMFKKERIIPNNRPVLQKLVDFIKDNSEEKAVIALASKGKTTNPAAIPYTAEAVRTDFIAVRQCMISENLDDNELAALIAVAMMKKHPKSISQLLSNNGYSLPPLERIIYLGTYVSTLQSLAEFTSIGIKKYQISSCGDSRVCAKCQKHDGKKHFVNKAVIGKNAPPFCERCRCIITAEF